MNGWLCVVVLWKVFLKIINKLDSMGISHWTDVDIYTGVKLEATTLGHPTLQLFYCGVDLLRAHSRNQSGYRGYSGWIGQDLFFSRHRSNLATSTFMVLQWQTSPGPGWMSRWLWQFMCWHLEVLVRMSAWVRRALGLTGNLEPGAFSCFCHST